MYTPLFIKRRFRSSMKGWNMIHKIKSLFDNDLSHRRIIIESHINPIGLGNPWAFTGYTFRTSLILSAYFVPLILSLLQAKKSRYNKQDIMNVKEKL
jgi:hypothetical protein